MTFPCMWLCDAAISLNDDINLPFATTWTEKVIFAFLTLRDFSSGVRCATHFSNICCTSLYFWYANFVAFLPAIVDDSRTLFDVLIGLLFSVSIFNAMFTYWKGNRFRSKKIKANEIEFISITVSTDFREVWKEP